MQPELGPAAVYEKLVHRTKVVGRFVWLMKLTILLAVIIFLVSLWTGDLKASLIFLFVEATMLLGLIRHNQDKLILKLVPAPRADVGTETS